MANIQYEISTASESRFLKPTGNVGMVNVVNDFAWTLSPKESRGDVPYVQLKEFQQNGGQLIASILYYARLANNTATKGVYDGLWNPSDPSEAYKFKYIADPTGWEYQFPFFSTTHTSRSNSFGYADGQNPFSKFTDFGQKMLEFGNRKGSGLARSAALVGEYAGLAVGVLNTIVPGKVSLESPQSWSDTSLETITVQFHLFNTQSIDDVKNNRNLAHILRYNNTPSRKNFAIMDPPVIYSLHIPDIVNLPACYMSALEITDLGNTRIMDLGDGKKKTIPEAYGFNMTFTSLLMPTRNILQALDKGENVEAISNIPGLEQRVKDYTNFERKVITGEVSARDQIRENQARTDFTNNLNN